jgi:Sulfotransferase family
MAPGKNLARSSAPVFVLGSPRSGTTLLYDMLLSAGGFAVYLAEANVFNLLAPRFGDLSVPENRRKLVNAWLDSKLFRASGLDRATIASKLLEQCQGPGDFLRIVMDDIAHSQGMQRWAENSPEGMLHLPAIKRQIPNALVVHIIRDGRDVAMSLGRVRYLRPFPWEERHSPIAAGVYWEWIVEQGRALGRQLGADYIEVHFEDLVSTPQATLSKIGHFIDHELDHERISQVGYGSVSRPNTSFGDSAADSEFNPLGRWKQGFSADQISRLEAMIGPTLAGLGYNLSHGGPPRTMHARERMERVAYRSYFDTKQRFKRNPLMRALRPELTGREIDEIVLAEDHAPEIRTPGSRPVGTSAGEKVYTDSERTS